MAATNGTDVDIRVQDYLNDKLQTEADLQNVDALLQNVQHQQELLKIQLKEANDVLESAVAASQNHEASLQSQLQGFHAQQADIDQRLGAFTGADTSDDAVKSFEVSMQKLRRLDIATGYLEILQEVDQLSAQALADLKNSPRSSVAQYVRLSGIGAELKNAQPAAEGAAPHLVDHVEQESIRLGADLKKSFADALKRTLDTMTWPQRELNLSEQSISSFTNQVELLLDLQEPDLKTLSEKSTSSSRASMEPPVLFPLEVMVEPLDLRFRYHFSGDRPTNRLDKPEYFLSHILDLLEAHNEFLLDYLQPILDRYARSYTESPDLIYTDAISSFISALLPTVRTKCLSLLPQLLNQPQLLSHFVNELMKFDDALRETWGYIPLPSALDTWKGLTWDILVTHGYFEPWLQVEKDFALARYTSIVSAKDCDELDYDSLEPGTTKPTKGAMRVNDLLETVTERYRPLSSFSQKIRFLIDVQIEIFDRYHRHLADSLNNHPLRQSALSRQPAAPEANAADGTATATSIPGLTLLLRVFGSASYLESAMQDWSDDVFFLELWDELQDRARQNSGTMRSVARDLSTAQIAEKTSAAIAPTNNTDEDVDTVESGALFDETASAYHRLRLAAESLLVESFTLKLRNALRSYSRLTTWSSLSPSFPPSPDSKDSTSPSADLDSALQILSTSLPLLSRTLAPHALHRIVRVICLNLQDYVWNYVLTRNKFSSVGCRQLEVDVAALWDVVDEAMRRKGEAKRVMRKLAEGLRVLGLPIRAEREAGGENDDGWGLDEEQEDDENGNEDGDENGDKIWGLWEVERRVFRSNESARDVLARMGLTLISESEARGLLERRVEVGS